MQSANNNANTGIEEENATNCAIKMDFILTILMKTAKIFLLFYKVPKRKKMGQLSFEEALDMRAAQSNAVSTTCKLL